MGEVDYLILGAGPAGCRAAQTIRRRDTSGRVVILTEEPVPFTNRIVLSKEFLKSDLLTPEQAVAIPAGALDRLGVELRIGRRISRLDPEDAVVELADGELIAYRRCLIATGARPLALPVPGFDLPGVHTLRTLDDALALRRAAQCAARAVVIGGGLIGAEVACALAARGMEVTLVAREFWLWGHLAPEPVGRAAGRELERGGVGLHMERVVTAIHADGSDLAVETASGEVLRAPLVVAGVGVRTNVDFLAGSELLEPTGGVRVDARLRTTAPGLWAAGDVAAFDDPLFGVRHRVEHWLHAQHQGRLAGENMMGDEKVYARVSAYDTRLFDLPVTVVGAPDLADRWTEAEISSDERVTALGWREERLVAAYLLGSKAATGDMVKRIESGAESVEEKLSPRPGPGSR
ncbi:MAG TPA: NAD(P)/FAD-dependent oxidoreductase [Gemmatimonadota bacterium]|nr:NAD(P)/FAD-dependent oxidoreductase [Gemmatimonadota bacterium]